MPLPNQPANGSKLIPEYSSAETKSWLGDISSGLSTTVDVVLILVALLGFVLFVMGIIRYMRAARDGLSGQGGDGHRESLWMIVMGASFALIGTILTFLVGIGHMALQ